MDDPERLRVERAQQLAIDRAVRDALVDRTLEEQKLHLAEINGSQRQTAESLLALEKAVEKLRISGEAVAAYVRDRERRGLSKRQMWLGALAMLATLATGVLSVLGSTGNL